MHSRLSKALMLITLASAFALAALLGASSAAARYSDVPRTATRGPQAATGYQPRSRTTGDDFSRADGIIVGGVLVVLAFGFGYALSSTRKSASVGPWDTASSAPTSSSG